MATVTSKLIIKSSSSPDEVRKLPKTLAEVVNLNSHSAMKATFQPGWRWSECVKPTAGTPSCQIDHLCYVISGRMILKMDDGTEKEMKAGDFALIPAGHDAWVPGSEPCVVLDFGGAKTYGKKK